MMCGGTSEKKNATEEIQSLCNTLMDDALAKSGNKKFSMFKALTYTSQVVAGTNYFVKVQVAPSGECIHARIFKPLPHTNQPAQLAGIQTGKKLEDPIEYFK